MADNPDEEEHKLLPFISKNIKVVLPTGQIALEKGLTVRGGTFKECQEVFEKEWNREEPMLEQEEKKEKPKY